MIARVVCFSAREVWSWESWVSRSLEAEAEAWRDWARSFQGGGGGGKFEDGGDAGGEVEEGGEEGGGVGEGLG